MELEMIENEELGIKMTEDSRETYWLNHLERAKKHKQDLINDLEFTEEVIRIAESKLKK